jgi:hypothetical protein
LNREKPKTGSLQTEAAREAKTFDCHFALEDAFPDISGLLGAAVFPSLKEQEVIVALDTNALLLPFEISQGDLSNLENAYKSLAAQSRLIVPGRVLREFVNLRDGKLSDLIHALNKRKNNPSLDLPALLVDASQTEKIATVSKSLIEAKKNYDTAITSVVDKIRNWRGNDPVTSMYNRLFDKNSFDDLPYDKSDREEYLAELEARFSQGIPPGYKDKNKDDGGIGDLLIWKTLLKVGRERKMHLAFVTGEEKSDWFIRADGGPVFPRIELIDEYRRASSGKLLRLLSLHELLRELDVSAETVNQIERVEGAANSEIRISRARETHLNSGTSGFLLRPNSTNEFRFASERRILLRIVRGPNDDVQIFAEAPAQLINLRNASAGVGYAAIKNLPWTAQTDLTHDDVVIVETGKKSYLAIRFNLSQLAQDRLLTRWSEFSDDSVVVLP